MELALNLSLEQKSQLPRGRSQRSPQTVPQVACVPQAFGEPMGSLPSRFPCSVARRSCGVTALQLLGFVPTSSSSEHTWLLRGAGWQEGERFTQRDRVPALLTGVLVWKDGGQRAGPSVGHRLKGLRARGVDV